jgi:hypothetical protein
LMITSPRLLLPIVASIQESTPPAGGADPGSSV